MVINVSVVYFFNTLFSLQVFIGFVLKQFEYIEVGQFRYAISKDPLNKWEFTTALFWSI